MAHVHQIHVVLSTLAVAPEGLDLMFASSEDIAGIMEMNEVARQVASQHGIPLLDFAKTEINESWFVDGVHLNEAGADFKARVFADFLEERLILDTASTGTN